MNLIKKHLPLNQTLNRGDFTMPIKRFDGDRSVYDRAIYQVLRTKTGRAIWNYLEASGIDYDVVMLGAGENFGQMLTDLDHSSPDAERGRTRAFKVFFKDKTIVRPVVLWNPKYDFDYFGDVQG